MLQGKGWEARGADGHEKWCRWRRLMPGKCKARREPGHSRREGWPFWEAASRKRLRAPGGAHRCVKTPRSVWEKPEQQEARLGAQSTRGSGGAGGSQRHQASRGRPSTPTDLMSSRVTIGRPLARPWHLLNYVSRDFSHASKNRRLWHHLYMTVPTVCSICYKETVSLEVGDTCTQRPFKSWGVSPWPAGHRVPGWSSVLSTHLSYPLCVIHSFNIQPVPLLCQALDKVVVARSLTHLDLQLSGDVW